MTPTADTITAVPLSQRVGWLRYLERTREAGDDYAEVEEAAWDELQKALTRIPASPEDAWYRRYPARAPPSASGLGPRPFKAVTRVRIPLGVSRPPGLAVD